MIFYFQAVIIFGKGDLAAGAANKLQELEIIAGSCISDMLHLVGNSCFVTPINQFLIILGRCTLYTPVCLEDEPTCMRIDPVQGSLTCTGDDCPCTRGPPVNVPICRTAHCIMSFLQMTRRKHVRTNKFSSPLAGIEPGTSSTRSQCANHLANSLLCLEIGELMVTHLCNNFDRDFLR